MMNGMFGIFKVEENEVKKTPTGTSQTTEGTKKTSQSQFLPEFPISPIEKREGNKGGSQSYPPTLAISPNSFTYPDPALRKIYEDFVGLSRGNGPWADFYNPIPFYTYFNPARHYLPPESRDYKKLLKRYRSDQCVECHEEVSPSTVNEWKMSNHDSRTFRTV